MKIRLIKKMMRQLIIALLLLVFPKINFAQEIEFGKYRLCYDMYWRCHFQNFLELKPDSTYEFIYRDDTQMEKTTGKWHIEPHFIVLTPFVIPDTIKITSVSETTSLKIGSNKNIVSVEESLTGIKDLNINLFSKGEKFVLKTNKKGQIQYTGEVVDSISFVIKGRELKVIPKRKEIPSLIWIHIDSEYKDLVFRQLGMNKIMIKDGRMFIRYRDVDINGKASELKTEYFEKIE